MAPPSPRPGVPCEAGRRGRWHPARSFFTRRFPQLLPRGWVRCTLPPHAWITSAASTTHRSLARSLRGAHRPWPARWPGPPDRCRSARNEGLPSIVASHDHAAPAVQVNADILLLVFHGSLLLSLPDGFRNPKCAPHTWFRTTGGLPQGLRLGSAGLGDALRWHGIVPHARRPSWYAHRNSSRGSCAALLHHINSTACRGWNRE